MSTEFLSTQLARNINSILQVYNRKTLNLEIKPQWKKNQNNKTKRTKQSINFLTVKLQFHLALVVFESSLTGVETHLKDSVRLCVHDISMVKLLTYIYS